MSTPEQERECEQAFIEMMQATDAQGRAVKPLSGVSPLDSVHNTVGHIAEWFSEPNDPRVAKVEDRIAALRHLELAARAYRLCLEVAPRHAGSCSNQNPVDPLGAFRGVAKCGCNPGASHFLSQEAVEWLKEHGL